MTRSRKAVALFAVVAVVLLAVTTISRYRTRPHEIPAPPYADSLAGVIVRVAGYGDSTLTITWWQSPEDALEWIDAGDEYAYKGAPVYAGLTPLVGHADLYTRRLTFAKGQLSVELAKHEMAHLILREPKHPAALFRRIEAYRGR